MDNTTEVDYTAYFEYRASVLIWKILPPILILLGTIGNSLSIIILSRKSLRNSATALYLTFLAFSDIIVLYTGLLRQWLYYLLDYDIRHFSEAACKIHLWLLYTSLDFSAWILMALTIERMMATWCPFRARRICSRLNAAVLTMAMLILLLLLNSHFVYGMINKTAFNETGNDIDIERCLAIDEKYTDFFNKVWPWIDLGMFCLIPLTVIVFGNICILSKVIKSQRRLSAISLQNESRYRRRSSTSIEHMSLTAMLLVLNTVFLITTLPISVYNIGYTHWLYSGNHEAYAELELWWAIVNMLMYTNNAINFLLYCLSGSRFRQEAKTLFCPRKGQGMPISLNNVTRSDAFNTDVSLQPATPDHDINVEALKQMTTVRM